MLTTGQAAKALRVHRGTVLRWLRRGWLAEPGTVMRGEVPHRVWNAQDMARARALKKVLRPGPPRRQR